LNALRRFIKVAFTKPVVSNALKVALVVGTMLNLINQGDALLQLHFDKVNWFKLLLTYTVPYGVSTYTAVILHLQFNIGRHSAVETDLMCQTCNESIHIKEQELVPECHTCGINTHWKAV